MPSRRELLATIGAGAAVGFAGCTGSDCTPTEPAGIDWPQPGGDPGNTAAVPDGSVPGRVGDRWRTPIVPDADLLAFAGAVVDGDRIVGLARIAETGLYTEYDLGDGSTGTRVTVPERIASPPVAVAGSTAVVSATDDGAELRLLGNGTGAGRYALGDAPATPRAAGTTLFGGDADGAFAYEVTGGGERWRREFGDEVEGGAVSFSPAVDDRRAYVAVTSSSDRGIYALNRSHGEVNWSIAGPRATRAPVRTGSLLLVPTPYELLAFDAETGERQWSTPTPADRRTFRSPAGTGAGPVVADGAAIHRLDPETGDLGWSVDFDGVGRPAVVGDAVLASNGEATRALELGDGSERWRLDDVSLVAPLGNGVLVRREDELIACTACEN
ncbi:PQQ-binding-like beta-propeller repeat protein [Halolamina sp. R1-12]|uniref:PQQ-like domain-containing protein n=2 Tax=Halolamina pelagica TaxID=699431 RepID=A0A1I5PSV0_9EURY|nr:PQQ-binding-like beta-propeller repeat protein [Halolamina sp. R1-12]SFP37085.1 PQQ-like domain-containing protein [Halolamina pelagica]